MARDLKVKDIPLTGKLVTSLDYPAIGENFYTLVNMRYNDNGIESVSGMTKINTTVINATYTNIQSAFQFSNKYDQAIFAYTFDSSLNSRLYVNTTAVPNQGNFSTTVYASSTVTTAYGRFSNTPNQGMCFSTGETTYLFGGFEFDLAAIIPCYKAGASEPYYVDYTNYLSSDDTSEYLNLYSCSSTDPRATSDIYLKFEQNLTNSGDTATSYTITSSGTIAYSTTNAANGYVVSLTGSGAAAAYVNIARAASLDFSGGVWEIQTVLPIPAVTGYYIVNIYDDASNYFRLQRTSTDLIFDMKNAGNQVTITASNVFDSSLLKQHVRVCENGNDYYLFVDGCLVGHTSSATRAKYYTSDIRIESAVTASAVYYDEYIINVGSCGYLNFILPPQHPFNNLTTTGTSSSKEIYIGSIYPLEGVNISLVTSYTNGVASTMQASYLKGNVWQSLNITDGTAIAGVTLAQSGYVNFAGTITPTTAMLNGLVLYWYRIYITKVDNADLRIYKITGKSTLERGKDQWDGNVLPCLSFLKYTSATYTDQTSNVYTEDYSSSTATTYCQMGSITYSTDYFLAGFNKPIRGIYFKFGDSVNTTDLKLLIYYWNGRAWTAIKSVILNDLQNGVVLFGKSGFYVWNDYFSVSKSTDAELIDIVTGVPLYYYKIAFSAAPSANVHLDYIAGIPIQETLKPYTFSATMQNRLWLCKDNEARCSALNTTTVLNGDDTTTLDFSGGPGTLTSAVSLYGQYGSSLSDLMVFFKQNETWVVAGTSLSTWVQYKASESIGCVAPHSLQSVHVGFEVVPGLNRYVCIFQGTSGVYLFDGKTIYPIHKDIENIFDFNKDGHINPDMLNKSAGFIDNNKFEYHWLFASDDSTTLNQEYVFDLKRQKWYTVDRGTGKQLQFGLTVSDSLGSTYTYGFINTGYMLRLDYGYTFDSNFIDSEFQLGNLLISPNLFNTTTLRKIRLATQVKERTTEDITVTHYGDSYEEGTSLNLSANKQGYTLTLPKESASFGPYLLHSLKFETSTNNETVGFRPYMLSVGYKDAGFDES